ncbi:MAG: SDR family oxidoreductase, partial [bacterium]|nr:SDR family oxidoreductase [bacterium]
MTQEESVEFETGTAPAGYTGLEIAVIGMAGRFPGAKNIHEFWENLKNGVESISFFAPQELEQSSVDPRLLENPNYIKAYGILEDVEYFDSYFFGYTPMEARVMDPQVRLFHECAWTALEDAGYCPDTYEGLIGVYAGSSSNIRWEAMAQMSAKAGDMGQFSAFQLANKDFLSLRISYKLNLKGPAVLVQSTCSTSLVAVHMACYAVLNGECDIALAGGVTVSYLKKTGYFFQEGLIMSPDGHCRAFDEKAGGTVEGNGAGVVVLKRLEGAIADRDHIYAVVKGSAINNDGDRKIGFTAPSVEGQVEAIVHAQEMAEVEPETITYVETHGTGTPLGDPIEIEALKAAFGTTDRGSDYKKNYCALGSVKTNMGHLDSASGVAGFIKAVLSIYHRLIPPSLHFENANPKIDLEDSPFYVNTGLREWKDEEYLLRCGVSAFGIGGTNARIVLEESPRGRGEVSSPDAGRDYQLIVLSAKTQTALEKTTKNLVEFLKDNPHTDPADAAYTLQVGRKAFKHRRMLVCPASTAGETVDRFSSPAAGNVFSYVAAEENPPVVFMFPGQGSQYADMGLELYETEPRFREEMDRCFEILEPLTGYDIKEILYPGTRAVPSPADHINRTEITQPVIFIIEYALAKLLNAWGITPTAMIGHSIGEYVAACLAGVFSLEHALEIVVQRGRLMQSAPTGSMLSVSCSEEELQPLLDQNPEISLAAVNSPGHCTVSGPHDAIDRFAPELSQSGLENRRLHTSHAFHSPLMDSILKSFEEKVGQIPLNKPRIPYVSNLTGKWITEEGACDPRYWADHLRQAVRFSNGVEELLNEKNSIFVEAGPGKALTTFVKKHGASGQTGMTLNLLRHPRETISDTYFLLKQIGRMWLYGKDIRWPAFYEGTKGSRIPLPTYPFEGRPYWLKGDPLGMTGELEQPEVITTPAGKTSDISQWFYTPVWEPAAGEAHHGGDVAQPTKWLVFTNEDRTASLLVERLKQDNPDVEIVKAGPRFSYRQDDYHALFEELRSKDKIPGKILHLWNVTPAEEAGEMFEAVDNALDLGFYSLVNLAREIGKQGLNENGEVEVIVLTNRMQAVTGSDAPALEPLKATVRGAVQVISREYLQINCRTIDIDCPEPASPEEDRLIDSLLAEMWDGNLDMHTAFRSNQRWIQTFERTPLEMTGSRIPVLKEKGVYLITGGLGGIGLVLGEYLAKTLKARLVLTGRSEFPAPGEWDQWLRSHETSDRTSRRIRKVRELEASGAEVFVLCADVANTAQMRSAALRAEERFGKINGIIHSAGHPGGGLIQRRTREISEAVFAPKVKGTLILDTIARERNWELDFILLCSSVGSLTAPVGQVAYSAANAFLDSYAAHANTWENTFTVSVAWDTWQEVGMAVRATEKFKAPQAVSPLKELQVAHPLFDRRDVYDSGREIFAVHLSVNSHWVLAGHRIAGTATLPGTAYLEMARAAVENLAGTGTVQLRDVYFLTPLTVEEDEEKEVHTILKKAGDTDTHTYTFSIVSRVKPGTDQWVEHARGEVSHQGETGSKKYKIAEIEAQCLEKEITYSRDDYSSLAGDMKYGPRWDNLRRAKFGKNQGIGFLELPCSFDGDMDFYKLHPALLDMATSLLRRTAEHMGSFLPFYYKRIQVKKPLPGKSVCYARPSKKNSSQPELLIYDITIMDEQGTALVGIEEYTMKKLDPESFGTGTVKHVYGGHEVHDADGGRNFSLQISAPGSFDSFEFRHVPRTPPGPGEVEIAVYSTGLNFREVLLALGALGPVDPGVTFGLECAGRITACGEGVDGFDAGDEVIAFGTSCFSPYITIPAALAAKKPANLNFAEAASIPVAFITAYYALIELGKLSKGERVLIHSAAGGVGMAAVQIARWKGAEIFATAGSKEKRKYLRSLGIRHVMNSRTLDFAEEVMEHTGGKGVDAVLNSLSGEFIGKSMSLLAPYGRFLEIGIRDMLEDTQLGLRPFLKGLSYFSIMLSGELPRIESVWREVVHH